MDFVPKQKTDYSNEEKIKKFDEFIDSALSNYDHIMKTNRNLPDVEQYAFEAIMELLGEKIWDVVNEKFNQPVIRMKR